MGGKAQLVRKTSLFFFCVGIVALGLQLAGVLTPFWLEDQWLPVARAAVGLSGGPSIRIFQGLWTDYWCREAYWADVNTTSDVIVSDCAIHLQAAEAGRADLTEHLLTLRGVEVASLILGFLSEVGVVVLYVTAHRHDCLSVEAQLCFTGGALFAGFLALVGMLMLAAEKGTTNLAWGLAFPTVSGFLWLANGSFSFLVCRYQPAPTGLDQPILMRNVKGRV